MGIDIKTIAEKQQKNSLTLSKSLRDFCPGGCFSHFYSAGETHKQAVSEFVSAQL